MSNVAKELLREYVNEQKFESTKEVLESMKDIFKDVLQEILEAEMYEHLGYNKHYPEQLPGKNSRNGYSKKNKIRIRRNRIRYSKR